MERMFLEGLIEVTRETGVVTPGQTSRAGGVGPVYNVDLPRLTGTELGYRCDSRDWATIQKQSGSKPVARVATLLDSRGISMPWNPLRTEERRRKMYLRKNSQDNALETVVSVAHDIRDTVTFPKPNQTTGPGGLSRGGEETVTIYVVWVPGAMDTSGLALDLWNASRWETGEVGAYEIPDKDHVAQFTVRRFYDPRVDSFVVGKVTDFKLLQPGERVLRLPASATHGLKKLVSMWDAGEIGWFRFGDPEKGNARHTALLSMWQLGADRIASKKESSPMHRRIQAAGHVDDYRQIYKDLNQASEAEEAKCETWLKADHGRIGDRTNVVGAATAVEAHASDLATSFAETRFTYVRQRLNPQYFALVNKAKEIRLLTRGSGDAAARATGRQVIDGARTAVTEAGAQLGRSRDRWAAQAPKAGATPERWEEFLMKVLGDPGA